MPQRFSDIAWPEAPRYWLADARLPVCSVAGAAPATPPDSEGVIAADLLIEDGMLARVEATSERRDDGVVRVDLGGRQVWPTLIDIHAHLDKGHTVARNPNVDGTFHNARLAAIADRPNWTATDLRRRMDFGLRCALAHGVSAIHGTDTEKQGASALAKTTISQQVVARPGVI